MGLGIREMMQLGAFVGSSTQRNSLYLSASKHFEVVLVRTLVLVAPVPLQSVQLVELEMLTES